MFIVSYVINNLASGILYDTYVNYLQEVSLPTATSFWAFYGYATFLSALHFAFGAEERLQEAAAVLRGGYLSGILLRRLYQIGNDLLSINPAGADRRTAAFHHAGSVCGSLRGSCGGKKHSTGIRVPIIWAMSDIS